MDLFNRSKLNQSEYIVADEPLSQREFKERVRKNRINKDTKVRRQSDKTWVRAGDVPELAQYFEAEESSIEDSIESLLDSIDHFTNEIKDSLSTFYGEKIEIPEQLYETLNDYLDKGTDEVALTMGKVNGQPALIVITIPKNQKPKVVAEIEIDTSGWRERSIREWAETGSSEAKIWQITRK